MSRIKQRSDDPKQRRTRIAAAALTGLIAGATRAILDTLVHHLTTGC